MEQHARKVGTHFQEAYQMAYEQDIRERAFQIWIEEGQPDGQDREHWERAKTELEKWPDAIGPSPGP